MAHRSETPRSPAVAGARVFDGERTLVDHAVLIEGGAVSALVPRDSVPHGTPFYHEPDCTVLPGLIDAHVHFMRWQGPQFLAYGVTTVRDAGNDLAWILGRRAEARCERWPRILCMGPLLDGPSPVHRVVSRSCADETDAVNAVGEVVSAGVDGVKLYVGVEPAWLPAIAQAGHAAGRTVSMHCAGGGVLVAARAEVDEFFHLDGILTDIWPDHPAGWLNVWGKPGIVRTLDQQRAVADALAASGITATPTLAYWDSQRRARAAGPPCLPGVPTSILQWQSVPADADASEEWGYALHAAQRFLGLLRERAVPVLAGTDVPWGPTQPGLSLWNELSLLVGAGLSPPEAIRAATSEAATFLGRSELGRLAPGSVADMVLVRGDPLQRIPAQPDIVAVVRGGAIHRPQDLLDSAEVLGVGLADEPWAKQLEARWASLTSVDP